MSRLKRFLWGANVNSTRDMTATGMNTDEPFWNDSHLGSEQVAGHGVKVTVETHSAWFVTCVEPMKLERPSLGTETSLVALLGLQLVEFESLDRVRSGDWIGTNDSRDASFTYPFL